MCVQLYVPKEDPKKPKEMNDPAVLIFVGQATLDQNDDVRVSVIGILIWKNLNMSRFTDYQVKQYERLFNRFAGKEKTVPLTELGQLLV
jgi:hypothetical protein